MFLERQGLATWKKTLSKDVVKVTNKLKNADIIITQ